MAGSAVLLFGPPAAGKSSLARTLLTNYRALEPTAPILYLGTDSLRETISGRVYLPSARDVVYEGLNALAQSALRSEHNILIDGNYLEPDHRAPLLDIVARCGARLRTVLVTCPLEIGLRRNSARTLNERVAETYLREAYARVEQARQLADLCLDSHRDDLRDQDQQLLAWLLEAPPRQNSEPQADLADWISRGAQRQLQPGEILWRAGQPSQEAVLVVDGQLEVVREAKDQPAVVINRLGPGDIAGDLSSLDGSPHSATVRAFGVSSVVSLSAADFRVILRQDLRLLDRVLQGMVGRIRSLSGRAGTAAVDLLTGLGNRRMLDDVWPHLSSAAQQEGEPLTVALFDIDRFKGINDSFGHQIGDVVLREISRVLQESIPDPGVCLRFGGDEFVVLLPGYQAAPALELMTKFAQRIKSTPMAVQEGISLQATISMGLASFPNPLPNVEELFRKADDAAYLSKRQGRDQVTAWRLEDSAT